MILDLVISCSEIGSELNIWVLGAIGTNADKHIEWPYSWPNFSDFDILIMDLNSLYKITLEIH